MNTEMWKCELSTEEINKLDGDKLNFALEESRVYLENISEKANRLVNKGFILISVLSAITGFAVSKVVEVILDPANISVRTIEKHWPEWILVLFCLGCLLYAFSILVKVVLYPMTYYPLGTFPKNLLRKSVLNFSRNAIIVKQMECYQQGADYNIAKNTFVSAQIRTCLRLAFLYPFLAIGVWIMLTVSLPFLLRAVYWVGYPAQ